MSGPTSADPQDRGRSQLPGPGSDRAADGGGAGEKHPGSPDEVAGPEELRSSVQISGGAGPGLNAGSAAVVPAAGRPGSSIFSLEGREAPGLYLIGWLASILGLAILFAVFLSAPGGVGALALAFVAVVLLSIGLVAAAGAQGLQRRARDGAGYSGPSPFLVLLATLPVAVLGVVVLLAPAALVGISPTTPAGMLLAETVLLLVNVGMIQLVVVSPRALSWSDMGLRVGSLSHALGDLAWGAVLAVPVLLVTGILGSILVGLLHQTPDNPLPPSVGVGGLVLNSLTAAIVAPAAEEIFFRGFAATAWFRSIGWNAALIRSSVFFAVVHVLNASGSTFGEAATVALIGFLLRLPVGLALGWVFLRRRSLFASFGLHAVFNGIQVIVAYGSP